MVETKAFRIFKDIIIRRHIREINFYFATPTFRECLSILSILLKSYLGKEDIVEGAFIKEFEGEFSKYIGVDSAFSFGAGRIALYAILKAIGIKEGDEVILPGYTCGVVPNAVIYCGAKPVYVDIDRKTFNIDISKIEEKITPHTKAIVAQHTFGLPVDMDKIGEIATRHNLRIIEDCAQALGAEYKGRKVGVFGDAAFFSFEVSKVITAGWGGMAVTSDVILRKKLEEEQKKAVFLDLKTTRKAAIQIILSYFLYHPWNYWWGKWFLGLLNKVGFLTASVSKEERIGKIPERYPCRLSSIQAMLGLSQLQKLDNINERRLNIAKRYAEVLKEVKGAVSDVNARYKHIYLRYTFTVDGREEAKEFFRRHQIELGDWFDRVIICTDLPLEQLNYREGSCPNAEWIAERNVNLPTHPRLSASDLRRIIKVTHTFLACPNDDGIKLDEFCRKKCSGI